MNTKDIAGALATLFSELVEGAPRSGAYMLNAGDQGLLRSLDTLSAIAASAQTTTGSSIAAVRSPAFDRATNGKFQAVPGTA